MAHPSSHGQKIKRKNFLFFFFSFRHRGLSRERSQTFSFASTPFSSFLVVLSYPEFPTPAHRPALATLSVMNSFSTWCSHTHTHARRRRKKKNKTKPQNSIINLGDGRVLFLCCICWHFAYIHICKRFFQQRNGLEREWRIEKKKRKTPQKTKKLNSPPSQFSTTEWKSVVS